MPDLISIELTNRCGKACWFCYNASTPASPHVAVNVAALPQEAKSEAAATVLPVGFPHNAEVQPIEHVTCRGYPGADARARRCGALRWRRSN
jgi:hypothetical protein